MCATPTRQRPSGLRAIPELPSGSHFCVLHASAAELLDALVPFVQAGLEANELCSWEVDAPLTAAEVTAALASAVHGFADHVARGQVEVVPAAAAAAGDAVERRLDRAILAGLDGLRIVRQGDAASAASLGESIRAPGVLTAFAYPRSPLGVLELMERVQEHPFALVCNSGRWEVLKGSEARTSPDALQRSEERLQSLFRNMTEGFAYHRIVRDERGAPCDYVFLEVNAAFERLTGLPADRIVGRRATQVLPGMESDPTDWIGKFGRVALTGEPLQFESHAAALDRWYAVSAFSSQRGYFAVTFSDITDRRRTERDLAAEQAALRESEARFRLLSDSASLLLSIDDPQRVVSRLCRAVMEHLDCQVFLNFMADPVAKTLHLDAHAGISEAEAHRIERLEFGVAVCGCAARDRRPIVAEDIPRSTDRRVDLVRSYGVQAYCCHPLLSEGRLLGTLSFGTRTRARFSPEDVALMRTVADQVAVAMDRIASQRALRDANERLKDADRRKDEFLAVLSHELRNPLAPIQNSLYVLDRIPPGGDQARRSLEVIRRQAGHLSRIVDDLLDVTRIARGKIRLQRQRVDLAEIVRRAADDYLASFQDAGVRLEVHAPGAPVWADADPTRLAQVVGNLLGNSLKFTPHGGAVELALRADGESGVLRVSDNGAGIARDVIDRLFQPFSQAEQTLDRNRGGLGLGLALVRGLAELHGGSASAESEGLGRGSHFTVRLPLVAAAAATGAAAPSTAGSSRRVLVIEDNVDAATSLEALLELWGHDVEVAYDGAAGIAAARNFRPDVVLCDLGLPGTSGHAVARALRADRALDGAYLVALSGYASPEDVQRAAESGFDRHLAKPPSTEALEEVLSATAARERPRAARTA